MTTTTRLVLDRIASSTRNAALSRDVIVGPEIVSAEGYVLAVRVLNDKPVYDKIEDVHGRMIPLRSGDVIAGTLGVRHALHGYAGTVPESIEVGDRLHVLNLGGVLGECTSINPELGPPFEAEVLGAILAFPRLGDRVGRPARIHQGAVQPATELDCDVPIVFVAGTSMNSGKTVAASEIVRGLTRRGLSIAGVKLTGVSLRRDELSMLDSGAVRAMTFNDAGIVSTGEDVALSAARGLLTHLAREVRPDAIVAELGDGILGEYGVQSLLADGELMSRCVSLVVCAPDQVGAWGASRILAERFGLEASVISGPVTDNQVGARAVAREIGVPAINARLQGPELVDSIVRSFETWNRVHG